jgi:hypothetical protein
VVEKSFTAFYRRQNAGNAAQRYKNANARAHRFSMDILN